MAGRFGSNPSCILTAGRCCGYEMEKRKEKRKWTDRRGKQLIDIQNAGGRVGNMRVFILSPGMTKQ